MRILVTGVTGQVGRALLSRLRGLGTIVAADRTELDLAQPQTIAAALDRLTPDVIINPAAYTAVDKAEDESELAMRVNGEAPGAIANWATGHRVPLIHFSTDYVFGGLADRAWCEQDETLPLSVYGASKLAGEEAIRSAGGSHLIIRTSWVYAAHGSNFLRAISRLARDRKELRVVGDQIGAPTSAAVIADAVAAMLGGGLDAFCARCVDANSLVHLAASGETSWHGFAVAIVEGLKARNVALMVEHVSPISSEDYPTRARRPSNSRLDLTRVHKSFGITTPQWCDALESELDVLAPELGATSM
jgi:dTDP-4-dehydrorhamnose reductase